MLSLARVEIHDFGCIRDVSLSLTRFHAFIGPNDSGKTTLLRAIRTMLETSPAGKREIASLAHGTMVAQDSRLTAFLEDGSSFMARTISQQKLEVRRLVDEGAPAGAQFVRLDPDAMRTSSMLLTPERLAEGVNERGAGLGALIDALIARDLDAYLDIRERVRSLFPVVADLNFPVDASGGKSIEIRLRDGTNVPAADISEGLLYYLGFSVIQALARDRVLLVEEPENGLHPARISEVVRLLREFGKTGQVLIATHSPLVVNELQPHEVTVVTRDADMGTQVTPIAQTPAFERRASVYALGELWLEYSNGEDEAPLLEGGPSK